MNRNRVFVLVLAALALLLTGCEEWANITPDAFQLTQISENYPEGPTKDALQATAIARYVAAEEARVRAEAAQLAAQNAESERQAAEAERQRQVIAMTAEAQSVIDARENAALATRQSINSQATAQAVAFDGTRQAQNLSAEATAQAVRVASTAAAESRNSTATIESRNAEATAASLSATATAESRNATATIQARLDNAQATAVQATAASVARLEERERITQPLLTFAPWLVGALGVVLLVILGFHGWRLFEDRARLVRRNPDEGEPIMLITRERLSLPMRQFGSYQDMTQGQERAPLLAPSVEYQDGATMRQQTVNLAQAHQVGRVTEAKHGGGTTKVVVLPGGERPQSRTRARKAEPGLLGVQELTALDGATAAGLLPPGLVEAIEAQWEEVED